MKTSKLFGVLVLTFTLVFSYTTAMATNAVSAKETRKEVLKKVLEQKGDQFAEKLTEAKMMKKATKASKFLNKKFGGDKVDFQSEPDRWMWFWLLGWAAGFVLYTIGWFTFAPFWYLGYLCWLGGTICLIIWLLKKTGNM